jgi:hypothetical protein
MKTSTAMMALVVGLSVPAVAGAQLFRREGTTNPRSVPTPKPALGAGDPTNPAAPAAGDKDKNVLPSGAVIPDPVNPKDLPPSKIPLPPDPIEPYLLTMEAGPFMVLAHTFKGENSEKYAQALAIELRKKYGLPAYVFRPKDIPMRSLIRGVPPTAAPGVSRPILAYPEAERIKDEAAVLVGNEKTLKDSAKLLEKVKHIHPATLDGMSDAHFWRKGTGLIRAIQTTNPYAPAEVIFPRKPDVMITQMNQGPHSIFTCPGRYSLQIAEFTGRKTMLGGNLPESRIGGILELRKSPLATAADDAEKLAAALARDKEFMQLGYVPYVYHDRYASRVMVGAFNSPNDPAATKLRQGLIEEAGKLNNRRVTDVMIVPASMLTDLSGVKQQQVQR